MKYILYLSFIALSQTVSSETFPHGWQLSTKEQYLKEDVEWYKGAIPNKIIADFNGDKTPDTAWVLTDKKKKKWGLFISLSSENAKPTIIKLDEGEITSHIYVGISPLKPGKYKTACGKGYWDCTKNEVPLLNLINTSIDYFMFESANSVYVWEEKESEFKRIWLSD